MERDISVLIYDIHLQGHLDLYWSEWFLGLSILHQENGNTLLTGPIPDQAALYSVLLKIHNLGLSLLSVKQHEVS